jgi:hypothetical protein
MLAGIGTGKPTEGPQMFDAVWTASLDPLKTRREVRAFLATGLNDLIGGLARQDLSAELSGLAIGSDREVVESYRRLRTFCESLSARDAKYAGNLVSLNVRDLFARALQRMKELPVDPRETLHIKPVQSTDVGERGRIGTTRDVSQLAASQERAKPAAARHRSPAIQLPV